MHSVEEYTKVFLDLLPPGDFFDTDSESEFYKLANALCQTFVDIDQSIDKLISESYPDTTIELLPEWEKNYGLPDLCTDYNENIQERQFDLTAKYAAKGGQTPAYFIQLAKLLGYDITITEYTPFRANVNHANDVLYGEDWQWIWQVNYNGSNPVYFRSNVSMTNSPLISYGNNRLVCFINKYKPAHTKVIFNFT